MTTPAPNFLWLWQLDDVVSNHAWYVSAATEKGAVAKLREAQIGFGVIVAKKVAKLVDGEREIYG